MRLFRYEPRGETRQRGFLHFYFVPSLSSSAPLRLPLRSRGHSLPARTSPRDRTRILSNMPHDNEDRLERQRRSVEAQIRAVFRGVTREGGVSWSESIVLDSGMSDLTREQARGQDVDRCWEELVDDSAWTGPTSIGGFSFLDPIGFRYYLAAEIVRATRGSDGGFLSFHLNIESEYEREQVSLLNREQAYAVARFVRFMIAVETAGGDVRSASEWSTAYKSHWRTFDKGEPVE